MRAHLDEAHAAADRLVREAQRAAPRRRARAAGRRRAAARLGRPRGERGAPLPDLAALLALLDPPASRPPGALAPARRALRELLLAVRALIDWYIERLGSRARRRPGEVEDIPMD